MEEDLTQEKELRRYLLGELSLEEQVLIEQRLFLESEYAELAQAVEDDLIDDYVRNDLPANEHAQFETHFLTQPEHVEDVKIAEALNKHWVENSTETDPVRVDLPPAPPPRSNQFVWVSLGAIGILIIGLIAWIGWQSMRRDSEQPQQAEQQPTPVNQAPSVSPTPVIPNSGSSNQTASQQNKNGPENRKNPPSQLATFSIYPGTFSRGGATKPVSLSADIKTVILKLPVKGDSESYSAILSSRRRQVQRWRELNSEMDAELGKIVRVDVSAALLNEQDYEIKLTGLTDDSGSPETTTYAFRVEKK